MFTPSHTVHIETHCLRSSSKQSSKSKEWGWLILVLVSYFLWNRIYFIHLFSNSCFKQQASDILRCEKKRVTNLSPLYLLHCSPFAVPLLDRLACVRNKNVRGLLSCWFQVTALPSDRRIGAGGAQVFLLSVGGDTHGCLKGSRRRRREGRPQSSQSGDALGILLNFLSSCLAVVILLYISLHVTKFEIFKFPEIPQIRPGPAGQEWIRL